MRLLLDTHTLVWWLSDDTKLSARAAAAIGTANAEVYVSAASAYEIALKHGMGRLPQARRLAENFTGEIESEGFSTLPIQVREAQHAGRMDHPHRDPFDRLLIAQAIVNDLTLVSNERIFDTFGVSRLW